MHYRLGNLTPRAERHALENGRSNFHIPSPLFPCLLFSSSPHLCRTTADHSQTWGKGILNWYYINPLPSSHYSHPQLWKPLWPCLLVSLCHLDVNKNTWSQDGCSQRICIIIHSGQKCDCWRRGAYEVHSGKQVTIWRHFAPFQSQTTTTGWVECSGWEQGWHWATPILTSPDSPGEQSLLISTKRSQYQTHLNLLGTQWLAIALQENTIFKWLRSRFCLFLLFYLNWQKEELWLSHSGCQYQWWLRWWYCSMLKM